jgi:hypothetical protein
VIPKLPMVGVGERCRAQFKGGSEDTIKTIFDSHTCEPFDSSQNALRNVRKATGEK